MRLFHHPASSASMRVTLYLGCRGVPSSLVELASTGFDTDHRGIPVFTMPAGGIVQPIAFDADKFEVCADLPGAAPATEQGERATPFGLPARPPGSPVKGENPDAAALAPAPRRNAPLPGRR